MKPICVFDVNETLLDLGALDPEFERTFGDSSARKEWFNQFIQSALVATVTNAYQPFGVIGAAAFDMIAARRGIVVSKKAKQDILGMLTKLPPHPEVPDSLAMLTQSGLTIAALTNSTLDTARRQLQNAGIAKYFDKILSADAVKRLKPAKEPYEMTARVFGVATKGTCLISAHTWDIAGAQRAGCQTAFIVRPGVVPDPLAGKPGISSKNLTEVVSALTST